MFHLPVLMRPYLFFLCVCAGERGCTLNPLKKAWGFCEWVDKNTPLIKFLWSFDILQIALGTGGLFVYENGFLKMSKRNYTLWKAIRHSSHKVLKLNSIYIYICVYIYVYIYICIYIYIHIHTIRSNVKTSIFPPLPTHTHTLYRCIYSKTKQPLFLDILLTHWPWA